MEKLCDVHKKGVPSSTLHMDGTKENYISLESSLGKHNSKDKCWKLGRSSTDGGASSGENMRFQKNGKSKNIGKILEQRRERPFKVFPTTLVPLAATI